MAMKMCIRDRPQEIFTPLFAMARIVGWYAHRNEELNFEGKRIIRPAYKNVLEELEYVPLKQSCLLYTSFANHSKNRFVRLHWHVPD